MKILRNLNIRIILFLLIFFCVAYVNGQNPKRFNKDIKALSQKEYCMSGEKDVIVFAGSSSIRMWKDVNSYFPNLTVINNGFGGSHMSDLLFYFKETITNFHPSKVFIYEGDNDIAAKKKPKNVLKNAKSLVKQLRNYKRDLEIIFISTKPSILRWGLKNQYLDYNKKLEKYCAKNKNLHYANIWDAMLNPDGTVNKELFMTDGLHMNKTGYEKWSRVLNEYVYKSE